MKLKSNKLLVSLVGLALAAVPFANANADAHGENINIYGWQNWSYEFIDNGSRDFDRLSNNAANIGFMAHIDTGMEGLQVGFRCEQFTYWGRNNEYTNWCNRNSKLSLRHEMMGEIMVGQWLLPYNEIVAQWVDPFYDAGADSHTSIMGNIGGHGGGGDVFSALFYNGSFDLPFADTGFSKRYGTLAFNRRQEGIVQYVWPNTSAMASQTRDGLQFRFAITSGDGIEQTGVDTNINGRDVDPRIMSTGVAYQHNMANGQIWLAAAYEQHEDVSAVNFNVNFDGTQSDFLCNDSDDEGYRLAARYMHDWGNGQSTSIAGMFETLEYDASCQGVMRNSSGDLILDASGNRQYADFGTSNVAAAAPLWTGVERDAFMISGKHSFGNGFDIRVSYMDADDLECKGAIGCTSASERDTDADAINVGVFYTMPAGTELRATYSEVGNEANAQYNYGINYAGGGVGEDVEMFAVGVVHYFD